MAVDFRSGLKLSELRRRLWSHYRTDRTFLLPGGEPILGFADLNARYNLDQFLLCELPQKIENVDKRFELEVVQSGSFNESVSLFRKHSDLETVEQEYDFLFVLKALKVGSAGVSIVEKRTQTSEAEPIAPGHAWIHVEKIKELEKWDDCFQSLRVGETFVSSTKIVGAFRCAVEEALRQSRFWKENVKRVEVNGPAVTAVMDLRDGGGTQVTLSFDFVLALEASSWPSCAEEWVTRSRKWPNKELVKEIVAKGVYLVPKPSKQGHPELEWRLSFSEAERTLFSTFRKPRGEFTLPGGRKITYSPSTIPDASCKVECYRVLKKVLKDHLSHPSILTSYFLKIIMLWASERHCEEFWESGNLAICFLGLLDDLYHCVVNQELPHYFVPSNNLLLGHDKDFMLTIAKKISDVRTRPRKYITTPEDSLGFQVRYSDTFIEDSENAQLEAMKNWFKDKPVESRGTPFASLSYKFTMNKFNPSREDNTFQRESDKNQ